MINVIALICIVLAVLAMVMLRTFKTKKMKSRYNEKTKSGTAFYKQLPLALPMDLLKGYSSVESLLEQCKGLSDSIFTLVHSLCTRNVGRHLYWIDSKLVTLHSKKSIQPLLEWVGIDYCLVVSSSTSFLFNVKGVEKYTLPLVKEKCLVLKLSMQHTIMNIY